MRAATVGALLLALPCIAAVVVADEPPADLPLSRFSDPSGASSATSPRRGYHRPGTAPATQASTSAAPAASKTVSVNFTLNRPTKGYLRPGPDAPAVDTRFTTAGVAGARIDATLPEEFRAASPIGCRSPCRWPRSRLPGPPRGTRADGVLVSIDEHAGPIQEAVLSPDGTCLATTDTLPGVRLTDPRTGRELGRLHGHQGTVSVAFSPDGRRLVTGGSDGRVHSWSLDPPAPHATLVPEWSGIADVAFTPDGGRLAVADALGGVRLLDPVDGIVLAAFETPFAGGCRLTFSPDGAFLAVTTAGTPGEVGLWNMATLARVVLFPAATLSHDHAFRPDGTTIVALSGATALEWDTATGSLLRTYEAGQRMASVAFLDGGARLLTGDDGYALRYWDTATGKMVASVATPDGPAERLAVAPDGSRLVTAHRNGTAILRDPHDGSEVARVDVLPRTAARTCTCPVDAIAFSADGSRVACHRNCIAVSVFDADAIATRFATAANAALAAADDAGHPAPRASASHTSPYDAADRAINGSVAYSDVPNDRWTAFGSPNGSDWLEIDLGRERRVARVGLALYDDARGVRIPERYAIEAWRDGAWMPVTAETHVPEAPLGNAVNEARFEPVETTRVRIVFTHRRGFRSGVSEVSVWGD